jgi:hypothetical protein
MVKGKKHLDLLSLSSHATDSLSLSTSISLSTRLIRLISRSQQHALSL